MANPLYRGPRNPIHYGYYPKASHQPVSTKPKVINIPVHFVGYHEDAGKTVHAAFPAMETKAAAALKIQKAVRGFLVRKNARVVRRLAAEVEDIERKVKKEENLIRRDAKERLKVSEALMSLLLRLDSVRGVRDLRKNVIRRVIGLQEVIDSISGEAQETPTSTGQAAGSEVSGVESQALDEETEISMADRSIDGNSNLSGVIMVNASLTPEVVGDVSMSAVSGDPEGSILEAAEEILLDREEPAVGNRDVVAEMETILAPETKNKPCIDEATRHRERSSVEAEQLQPSKILEISEGCTPENYAGGIDSRDHRQTLDLNVVEVPMTNGSIDETKAEAEEMEGSRRDETKKIPVGEAEPMDQKTTVEEEIEMIPETKRKSNLCSMIDTNSVAAQLDAAMNHNGLEGDALLDTKSERSSVEMRSCGSRSMEEASGEETREMREVMQRMAADNEGLKGMVAELCARSSEQCRLVEALVGRVEQLERIVHKMENRRRKRKSAAACSALSTAK